jgi:hypothetical protein
MSTAKLIITHGGVMHQDDLMAAIIALGANPNATWERRDPTLAELEDPDVWVIDVGRQFDLDKSNMDHHQFEDLEDTRCSVHLVFDKIGLTESAKAQFPWLDLMGLQDNTGVPNAATFCKTSPTVYNNIKGPWIRMLSRLAGCATKVDAAAVAVFRQMGQDLLEEIVFLAQRKKELEMQLIWQVGPYRILDMRGFCKPTVGIRETFGDDRPHITIMDDLRNGGSVLSVDTSVERNNPALMLNRYVQDQRVGFAHKSGFMLVLKPAICPLEFLNSVYGGVQP